MGEIAEAILDGILCEQCGEYMGDAVGYPRTCRGCMDDNWDDEPGDWDVDYF